MISAIDDLNNYNSFLESFYGDLDFSDPLLNEMKEANEDIAGWIEKPDHHCFASQSGGKTLGLFVFIIYESERYIEMLAGLSRDADAIEEMLVFLEGNYPGYHADFVFNPRWSLFMEALRKRGAP